MTAIVLASWAFSIRDRDSDIGNSITYLILSVLGVSLLLSVRWLRSNKFYTFLLSFMTCLIYIFCTLFPGFIIGSIFVRCEALLRPSMEQVLEQECIPYSLAACRVLPAQTGEHLGNLASIMTALYGAGMEIPDRLA